MRVVRPFLVVLVVATSTTVVAACAQTDPATPTDRPATSTSSLVADRADVHFAQQMIIHHQGALDMAALAPQRAGSAQVAALARRIAAAQQPEIDLMSGWLEAWGAAVPDEDATMPGMHQLRHRALTLDIGCIPFIQVGMRLVPQVRPLAHPCRPRRSLAMSQPEEPAHDEPDAEQHD